MQSKFSLLEEYLPTLKPDLVAMIDLIIANNRWDLAIEKVKSEAALQPAHEQTYYAHSRLEFIFEYALSKNKFEFIANVINFDDAVSAVRHDTLLEYALTRDNEYQELAIAAMIRNPMEGAIRDASISRMFENFAANVYLPKAEGDENYNPKDEQLVRNIMCNHHVEARHLEPIIRQWVRAYVLIQHKQPQVDLLQVMHKHLPNNSMVRATTILTLLTYATEENQFVPRAITNSLKKFKFTAEETLAMLESQYLPSNIVLFLKLFLTQINPEHPKFQRYNAISELLSMEKSKRHQYLIEHPGIFAKDLFTRDFYVNAWYHAFDKENHKYLLEHYIADPTFDFGPEICPYFCDFEEDLATRYLAAKHTLLPINSLRLIVSRFGKNDPHLLIQGVFLRKEYKYYINDVIEPIQSVLLRGHKVATKLLLENENIIDLMKQYYTLQGDNQLSLEEHGTLLPSVLAWYTTTPRFLEIFESFSDEQRNELLRTEIYESLHPDSPTLKGWIMQKCKPEIIHSISRINPRFVQIAENKNPIIMMPSSWMNHSANKVLHAYQRRFVVKVADKKSEQFDLSCEAKELQSNIEKIIQTQQPGQIRLLHQTRKENLPAILKLSSKLQARHHIHSQNFAVSRSKGLTDRTFFDVFNAHSLCCFFTHLPSNKNIPAGLKTFQNLAAQDYGSLQVDLYEMLNANRHIDFIIIGPTQFTIKKELQLSDCTIISDPSIQMEGIKLRKIRFTNAEEARTKIHRHLIEMVLTQLALPAPVITRLQEPKNDEDRKLLSQLIDLLHLEWLIPGDINLYLSYIDEIISGVERFDLLGLRQIVLNAPEEKVLAAIDNFVNLKNLRFVVRDIINLATKRGHTRVITRMMSFMNPVAPRNTVFYSHEVYQIESLAQLILEDLNNDRVYAHFNDTKVTIHSVLKLNSNRNAAHHAEMAKLRFALGSQEVIGESSLSLQLAQTLDVQLGADQKFKTLAEVRDALLTYELTTLCVSYQNTQHYFHHGMPHPVTGKGATNGKVALLANRLFCGEQPYALTVQCRDNRIFIKTSSRKGAVEIAKALVNVLKIDQNRIHLNEEIMIDHKPTELIAMLRRTAIFYEGLNVITNEGALLLAYRHDKGLATAGGHHDKYTQKGIAHSLESEFDLAFKDPKNLEKVVTLLYVDKTISKTGIYVIPRSALKLADKSSNPSASCFKADPDEFVVGSEKVLTLKEMRGEKFYDVMPLVELCEYQKQLLSNFIAEHFPEVRPEIRIDKEVRLLTENRTVFKVPAENFGKITIVLNSAAQYSSLVDLLRGHGREVRKEGNLVFEIDQSPLFLITQFTEILHERVTSVSFNRP